MREPSHRWPGVGQHAWGRWIAVNFTLLGQLTGISFQCMTARRCANVLAGGERPQHDRHLNASPVTGMCAKRGRLVHYPIEFL